MIDIRVVLAAGAGMLLLVTGCSNNEQPAGPQDNSTFAMIQKQVFDTSCSSSSCHSSANRAGGLSLAAGESFANLINAAPDNEQAKSDDLKRVLPSAPEKSFLLKKLTGPGPNEGRLMPYNSSGLNALKIDAIREWIKAGASATAHVAMAPDLANVTDDPHDTFVPPAPPAANEGIQIKVGPFYVQPGAEREIFSTVTMDLPPNTAVNRMVIAQPQGSHHFIVYRWKTGDPPPPGIRDFDPAAPRAFEAFFNRTFVTGTQSPSQDIVLPAGVGIELPEQTIFDLNSHFVNLGGSQSLRAEVYVNFYFAPAGAVTHHARVLFENNLFINVPPGATQTTGANWYADRDVQIIALSSHMHRHGTRFTIAPIVNGGAGDLLYENVEWDNPLTVYLNPPLQIRQGDGLRYEGTFTNDDKSFPLRFGFSAEDNEMCIMTGYYY